MILAATLLWAVEVILVKRLLAGARAAHARRGADGARHARPPRLGRRLGPRRRAARRSAAEQWAWAILTGLLLTAYVATWYAALARAQAVDVTAVLVFGAVVTALLAGAADGVAVDARRRRPVTAGAALVAARGAQARRSAGRRA